MPSGWRIQTAAHAATAFSGEGTRRYGARWNSPGTRLVYLSEHQSLALLEVYVRKQGLTPRDEYVLVSAEWEQGLMETVRARDLPASWRMLPAPRETRARGDQWVKEARSVVLAVPSVIVPAESNYLINPAHPDFPRIKIGQPSSFVFDPRLYHR